MSCFTPLKAFRAKSPDSLDFYISFKADNPENLYSIDLPCGKCVGCKLAYALQWAIRCSHEASLHDNNCFLTLTFNDENYRSTLAKEDIQLFMKRLRKKYPRSKYGKISYFACGEYGELGSRAHYHICLFNFDFKDKIKFAETSDKHILYNSQELSELWPFGYAVIGDVSFESAAYVARYCTKKIQKADRADYLGDKQEEFTLCSRRPAIGQDFFKRYENDIYNYDLIELSGKQFRVPRYYDKLLEKNSPERFSQIKLARENDLLTINSSEHSQRRLSDKHEIQLLKQCRLSRNLNLEKITPINSTNEYLSLDLYDKKILDYHKSNYALLT